MEDLHERPKLLTHAHMGWTDDLLGEAFGALFSPMRTWAGRQASDMPAGRFLLTHAHMGWTLPKNNRSNSGL